MIKHGIDRFAYERVDLQYIAPTISAKFQTHVSFQRGLLKQHVVKSACSSLAQFALARQSSHFVALLPCVRIPDRHLRTSSSGEWIGPAAARLQIVAR